MDSLSIPTEIPRLPLRSQIGGAFTRARQSILAVGICYILSVTVGVVAVHQHMSFAMAQMKSIVGQAGTSTITEAYDARENVKAALLDVRGNMLQGALPKTVMGLAAPMPFPWIAYQGWIGGIVSVQGDGTSRFNDPRSAAYYLLTLLFQLTGFSITVGAGVNAGVSMFRTQPAYEGKKFLNLVSMEALRDIGRLYLLALPFFLVGSLWEFLSPWNIWVK